jgi:hypothetical protein
MLSEADATVHLDHGRIAPHMEIAAE